MKHPTTAPSTALAQLSRRAFRRLPQRWKRRIAKAVIEEAGDPRRDTLERSVAELKRQLTCAHEELSEKRALVSVLDRSVEALEGEVERLTARLNPPQVGQDRGEVWAFRSSAPPAWVAALEDLSSPSAPERLVRLLHEAGFSAQAYREANPDLHLSLVSDEACVTHFLRNGCHEQRPLAIEADFAALHRLRALPARNFAKLMQLTSALAFAHVSRKAFESIPERWAEVQAFERLGARPYFLIGDSHAHNYRRTSVRGPHWLLPLHLNCTAGSALGLANPASRSGYGPLIRHFQSDLSVVDDAARVPTIWKFGQVDAEFVQTFKRVAAGERAFSRSAYEQFCQRSVESYTRFLAEVVPPARRSLAFVASLFPPALSDAMHADGYVNAHVNQLESDLEEEAMRSALKALEIPDLGTRTALHRYYNERLESAVGALGFRYLDGFSGLLGADGLLHPRFCVIGKGRDHHVDFLPSADVLVPQLWDVVDARP